MIPVREPPEEKGEKREIPALLRFLVQSDARGRFFADRLPSPHTGRRGEREGKEENREQGEASGTHCVSLDTGYRNVPRSRFAISMFTTRYGRYIPVRQVAGTRTVSYRAVPPKIDGRLKGEIDCRRSIEREKGRKKKKRKKKKKEKKRKNTYRRARSSPVRRRRSHAVATRGRSFSRTGR
ncbi:hypothetical protein BHE74_00002907 [Ensete ventricosum]|nr:hypothetical protein BHE74_00002907 [Ensete ventricosum]